MCRGPGSAVKIIDSNKGALKNRGDMWLFPQEVMLKMDDQTIMKLFSNLCAIFRGIQERFMVADFKIPPYTWLITW